MTIDLQILKTLNGFIADKGFWYHIINAVGNNPLIRGAPILGCLAIVALSRPSSLNKSKIILGFIGTFTALIISVYCQSHLHIHLRPIFDKAVSISPLFDLPQNIWGTRIYSLPSDTATAFFGISSIIYIQNKKLGLFCFFCNIFAIGICRVALGLHYPSDILTGIILGVTLVFTFTNIKIAQNKIQYLILNYDTSGHIFNILILLFCAETYTLFPGFQPTCNALIFLIKRAVTWL